MNTTTLLIWTTACLLGLSPPVPGMQSMTLRGQVLMPNGSPATRELRLVLDDAESFRTQEIVYTDSNGRFVIRNVPSGSYRITVDSDGPEFSTTVKTIRVEVAFSEYVIITLLPPPRARGGPSGTIDARIPVRAQEHYGKAVEHLKKKQDRQAEGELKKALEAYPDYFEARNDLGMLYLEQQRLQEAESHLSRAAVARPDDFRPQYNLGVSLLRQQRFAEAADALQAALRLEEDLSSAHYYLGVALYGLERLEDAETHLQEAYRLNPSKEVEALMFLGNVYYLQGESGEAIEHFEKYLEAVPGAPNAAEVRQAIDKVRKEMKRP